MRCKDLARTHRSPLSPSPLSPPPACPSRLFPSPPSPSRLFPSPPSPSRLFTSPPSTLNSPAPHTRQATSRRGRGGSTRCWTPRTPRTTSPSSSLSPSVSLPLPPSPSVPLPSLSPLSPTFLLLLPSPHAPGYISPWTGRFYSLLDPTYAKDNIPIIACYISPWTGRFYSLLDPTYAKDNIPIIASVSEHQPTAWSSFFFDFHILLILFPAGLYFCFKRLNDASMFVIIYGLTAMYFAGVMVRLILVATPALCLLGAVAVSASLSRLSVIAREKTPEPAAAAAAAPSSGKLSGKARDKLKGAQDSSLPYQKEGAVVLIAGIFFCLINFARHCTWVTSEAYSSPSIVLMARQHNGDRVIFDDFREAYFWLKHNTKPDAKVMSWWDYGYQITAMANRTVIVDNNTWNNTHIATVGRAMASHEEQAYGIMQQLDVDYVLVVFGGVTGYSSDDINKFLWMVRIGGGVFPDIKEPDYLNNGDYRTDANGSPKMLNCLMYKMCYYRFGELQTEYGKPTGWDRARGYEIGNKDIELEYIEEAFTSSNWIVRIYRVKQPDNRW
ncbi:unnamed protein product [Closterium sp. Naga37s-1]|nr:unnamed protein product [Closterium sp. Naga37s-1]